MFPLLSLPTELVHPIIEAINDRPTLIAVAQTSSALRPFAEAQLFRDIAIRDGDHAKRASAVFEANPLLRDYVHGLELTPGQSNWGGTEELPEMVKTLKKLKVLHVESPFINGFRHRWWADRSVHQYMKLFSSANDLSIADAPLRCLTSFTFHSHSRNERYYDIQVILPIFLSPTLQYIFLSCASMSSLEQNEILATTESKKTPLRKLILEECNISPSSLSVVLSLPRALTSLSLRETDRHFTNGPYLSDDLQTFHSALSQQSRSLTYLQHTCSESRSPALDPLCSTTGFSHFPQLQTIELDWRSSLIVCLQHAHLAPPSLSMFRYVHLSIQRWDRPLQVLDSILPSTRFKHLELHVTPLRLRHNRMPEGLCSDPDRAKTIAGVARKMKQHNITTTLVGYHHDGYVIPPYVFGEQRPEAVMCFSSSEFWVEEEKYEKLVRDGKFEDGDGSFDKKEKRTEGSYFVARAVTGYEELNRERWRIAEVKEDVDADGG